MSYCKHWVFTLNNPTLEDEDSIRQIECVHAVVGRETGDSGTPHLQGYIHFATRKRMSAVKRIIARAHWESCRNIKGSITYCKKDGDFFEIGEEVASQGKRSDLDAFKDAVKNGEQCRLTLMEEHSTVYAKYGRFFNDYLVANLGSKMVEEHPLREWQQSLNSELQLVPDARKIKFIVDISGNQGKTWFSHYYTGMHSEKSQVLLPGKKADMVFALKENLRVVFLDCARSKQGEFIQYDFLEELKNGYVFCPKYESRYRTFGPLHVVVLTNELPDMNKLSIDRYDILEL